ncbi:amidohydrolase family protein [Nocardioides sp. BP30]|uniref:amidohydrolase family protein n=1 Tax=Nocardioides sp. BP30 TaxID=3036374 RepID=UPI002468D76F|nr:amidohydrolase family protein [Nocardioides sp. BP30]WGL54028.1 amidohydrolase family protein [Nocardioides sp. BP30]
MSLLIRRAEIRGAIRDVHVARGRVTAIGDGLPPAEQVIDAAGGALLPGLHDHHLHVLALTAAWESVDCSAGLSGLTRVPGEGWIRGVNCAESLDRHALDRLVPTRPVRVQHRSGALWMLNSAALEQVSSALDDSADVERDEHGEPTGRLWRYDARLRGALPSSDPDVAETGRRLAGLGITGLTDATPDLDPRGVELLRRVPQRLTLLGDPAGTAPRKLHLRDHDLPSYDQLVDMIARTHAAGRAVAVHCVTRASLVLTLAVLEDVGTLRGDRIEHAAVVPESTAAWMARLGLVVVTQPDFLRTRGDSYRREVAPDDLPCLYPYASLIAAGVPTCASSDAPYGEVDPWRVMASAADRAINPAEAVPVETALAGYLSPPQDPGGPPRRVAVGEPADLVLLDVPVDVALRDPDARHVRLTLIAGSII